MTKEEREKAINKIMGYLATYLSVEQYAEAEKIIKELRQDTVSRESYEHEYFLRKEFDFKIAKLEKAIEALEQELNIDKILDTINFEEKWLLEAGYNCSNVNTAFRSIKHDLRKLGRKSENKVGWSSLENVRNKVEKENEE